jgi:hypothetical protein
MFMQEQENDDEKPHYSSSSYFIFIFVAMNEDNEHKFIVLFKIWSKCN